MRKIKYKENILYNFFPNVLCKIILNYAAEISTKKLCLHVPDEIVTSILSWSNIQQWINTQCIYKNLFAPKHDFKTKYRQYRLGRKTQRKEIAKMFNIEKKEISNAHMFFAFCSHSFYGIFTSIWIVFYFFKMWKKLEKQRSKENDVLCLLVNLFREIIIVIGIENLHTKPLMALLFIVALFESTKNFDETQNLFTFYDWFSPNNDEIENFLPFIFGECQKDQDKPSPISEWLTAHVVCKNNQVKDQNFLFSEANIQRAREQLIQFWRC